MITYDQMTARLDENGLQYGELPLENGGRLLITARGGRIFAFLPGRDESLFWANPAFDSAEAFRAFLDADDWNLGGERVWIAPEIQFRVRDRADFWNSLFLPEGVDPGRYTLTESAPGEWMLFEQDLELEAHNIASGRVTLHIGRTIRAAPDPLRNVPGVDREGVTYAGYEHMIGLTKADRQNPIMAESWDLIQLYAGGNMLIPASPEAAPTDYFEPVDDAHQTIAPDHIRLRITGDRRYKVGYKAAHVFGRLAYHLPAGDEAVLMVRNFPNDPSSVYMEEPADRPGVRGCSVHVYNDGGMFGGFGEMECNGRTIGPARPSSRDTFALWLYAGPAPQIASIARHLLGVEI